MLSVSTLLMAVFLLVVVVIFYRNCVIDDFDNDAFGARVNVLREYLRTVGGDARVPPSLGYVSRVDGRRYAVTHFDTATMRVTREEVHDETRTRFNFSTQDYSEGVGDPDEASVAFHPTNPALFVARTDDGDATLDCGTGDFDGTQCVPEAPCPGPNTTAPLTGDLLNRLVFDKFSARRKPRTGDTAHHPTVYVRCDGLAEPHLEECDAGELFVDGRCQYAPPVATNGRGLVTYHDGPMLRPPGFVAGVGGPPARHVYRAVAGRLVYRSPPEPAEASRSSGDEVEAGGILKLFSVDLVTADPGPAVRWTNGRARTVNYGPPAVARPVSPAAGRPPDADRRVAPVNDSFPRDNSPCLNGGVGHTFVVEGLGPDQYLECLDGHNLFLHSCGVVLADESGRLACDTEIACADFEDGAGTLINSVTNDHLSFDTGRTVCRGGTVAEIVECDTGDFAASKRFDHPLSVTLEVRLPRQVYDHESGSCVDYSVHRVRINNDGFRVTVAGRPEFSRLMVGRVSKIRDAAWLEASRRVSDVVTYGRDVGEIGLDFRTCAASDCARPDGVTFDAFDNTRYNLCAGGAVAEVVELSPDQFVDAEGAVRSLAGYGGQCRYAPGGDYFDLYRRTAGGFLCEFTFPAPLTNAVPS